MKVKRSWLIAGLLVAVVVTRVFDPQLVGELTAEFVEVLLLGPLGVL